MILLLLLGTTASASTVTACAFCCCAQVCQKVSAAEPDTNLCLSLSLWFTRIHASHIHHTVGLLDYVCTVRDTSLINDITSSAYSRVTLPVC